MCGGLSARSRGSMRSLGTFGSDADGTHTAAGSAAAVASGSDAVTRQCGLGQQLANKHDRYGRYCGYSRKKCVACGMDLTSADDNCGKTATEKGLAPAALTPSSKLITGLYAPASLVTCPEVGKDWSPA